MNISSACKYLPTIYQVNPTEQISILLYYSAVVEQISKTFPHFWFGWVDNLVTLQIV